jgi:Na+/melibiose symporter-like transporter
MRLTLNDIMVRVFCSHPLSSMVFGLNALITKPSISLAPMVTVAILNAYGYSEVQRKASESAAAAAAEVTVGTSALTTANSAGDSETLTSAMFIMSCLVPICIGMLQLIVWSFYTFRDSHKKNIRDDTISDEKMELVQDTQL